jgi:hypothetical protein
VSGGGGRWQKRVFECVVVGWLAGLLGATVLYLLGVLLLLCSLHVSSGVLLFLLVFFDGSCNLNFKRSRISNFKRIGARFFLK